MKPSLPAEWEVSSEELCILAIWFLSPVSKNSVFDELRSVEERFEGEKCLSQSWVGGKRRRAEYYLHKDGDQRK